MEFPTIDKFAKDVAEKALDGYIYEGKTLREWIHILEQTRWIPIKTRNITDEEREKEDYPKEWHSILECKMPEEGEEILVTIKGHKENYVEKDTAYNDCDGWYLDGGYDWGEDVIAWMPLPQPYKAESENKE